MYFEHFIKLKTNHNIYTFENVSDYSKIQHLAYEHLKKDATFFDVVLSEENSMMTESNGCFTFKFYTKFKSNITADKVNEIITNIFKKEFTITLSDGKKCFITTDMENKEYTIFRSYKSNKLNSFYGDKLKPLITNENDIPPETRYIEVQGLMGRKASDPTELFIFFYNSDGETVRFPLDADIPLWINQFKDLFSQFSEREQMYINYKFIINLLIGETNKSFKLINKDVSFVKTRSLQSKEISDSVFLNSSFSMNFRKPTGNHY